jgi:hypothetical protein
MRKLISLHPKSFHRGYSFVTACGQSFLMSPAIPRFKIKLLFQWTEHSAAHLSFELFGNAGASFTARFAKKPIASFGEKGEWDDMFLGQFFRVGFAAIDATPERWIFIGLPLDNHV